MGSEISSLVIEPIMGIVIVTMSVFSIIRQNQNEQTSAKWFSIGATSLTILLIAINILMTMMA